MRSFTKNQSGIAHLLALAVLVIVAVASFAGYRVWQNQNNPQVNDSVTKAAATIPATIDNTTSLDQASTVANSLQLDSDLDPSQLDSDVNSLL